jgi:hypothetical protein
MCINMGVRYQYQIKEVLKTSRGLISGFRVLVVVEDLEHHMVDVPAEIFEYETLVYFRCRLKMYQKVDIQKLPLSVQYKIRMPLAHFLDLWVLTENNGYYSKRKNTDA